jgi:hypothetical protein
MILGKRLLAIYVCYVYSTLPIKKFALHQRLKGVYYINIVKLCTTTY